MTGILDFSTKRNVSTYLCTHTWGRKRRPALGRKQKGLTFPRWTSCHTLALNQPWSVYLHRPQPCEIEQVVMEQSERLDESGGMTTGEGTLIACWSCSTFGAVGYRTLALASYNYMLCFEVFKSFSLPSHFIGPPPGTLSEMSHKLTLWI